jgi:hypothetical protein
MTTIYDFLKFKQEIKELHEHVASLSEQVVLLQKQVILPQRTVTVAVSYAAFGLEERLTYRPQFGGSSGEVLHPTYIAVEYCLVDQKTNAMGELIHIQLCLRQPTRIDIPAGHTISISSAKWMSNTDKPINNRIDAIGYLKATGIERW